MADPVIEVGVMGFLVGLAAGLTLSVIFLMAAVIPHLSEIDDRLKSIADTLPGGVDDE